MAASKLLHMPSLAQIGLYVKDLEKATRQYEELFGIGPWLILEGETVSCVDRGCEAQVKGRLAMGYSGKIQLELIQITGGSNLYLDTLGGLEEGIHHMGFAVNNLEERLQACREAGIEVLQRATLKQLGMTIDYAYLDTREQVGVILEFIQSSFLGIKTKQAPWMLKMVARMQRRFGLPPNPIKRKGKKA
jgi:catechol 2,3-dioxygenase-like lactoylglutathione lyase family enzyme